MLAIETNGLTKRYGGRVVVDGVALAVPAGRVYGFLGPNGAGKTTTMRMLLGLERGDAGSVRLLGHDVARDRIAALRSVGAFIESPSLYDHLTGRMNLDLTRCLLDLPRSEVSRVLEVVDLSPSAADRRVGGYSLGMKQRLALARALLGAPRLLLLDEPTNGLDPDGIIAMRQLIRGLPDRIDGTVFMASHLLGEVEQVASVTGLMAGGRLVLQGSVCDLLGNDRSLRIECDDGARGAAVATAAGCDVTGAGQHWLRIDRPGSADARAYAAHVNALLIRAGLEVSLLAPEPRTLEDVYRDAVATPRQELAA